jgi:hypothetical protein
MGQEISPMKYTIALLNPGSGTNDTQSGAIAIQSGAINGSSIAYGYGNTSDYGIAGV